MTACSLTPICVTPILEGSGLVSQILLNYPLNIIQTICSLFGTCPFFDGKERTKDKFTGMLIWTSFSSLEE